MWRGLLKAADLNSCNTEWINVMLLWLVLVISLAIVGTWLFSALRAMSLYSEYEARRQSASSSFSGSPRRLNSEEYYSSPISNISDLSWRNAPELHSGSLSGTYVNPVTGLAMSSMGGIDSAGNLYGTNISWDDHSSSSSSPFERTHY